MPRMRRMVDLEESGEKDQKNKRSYHKKRFIAKFSNDHRLTTGGRKSDSLYFRRQIVTKKIAIIHYLLQHIEQLIIVSSFVFPRIKLGIIDRFIVLAESSAIKPIIIFTKRDLVDENQAQNMLDTYKNTGCVCFVFSNDKKTRQDYNLIGPDYLRENIFKNQKSAVVGHSGVGKTTMLNLIDPKYQARTAPISDFTKKGCHTTTRILFYEFSFGGIVYDMPGLKELDYINLGCDEVKDFYKDFDFYKENCQYKNCTHDHEKNCAVKNAFFAGNIATTRYKSYLQIRKTLKE